MFGQNSGRVRAFGGTCKLLQLMSLVPQRSLIPSLFAKSFRKSQIFKDRPCRLGLGLRILAKIATIVQCVVNETPQVLLNGFRLGQGEEFQA